MSAIIPTLIFPTTMLAMAAIAQTTNPAPSFAVASVKPNSPSDKDRDQHIDPGRFSVKGTALRNLLMMAYGIPGLQFYRISGPAWTETELFDIDARAETPASRAEMMLMLRSLLADRFQVKVHFETRPILTNVLVVAKGGPKFGPDFYEVKDGDPPADLGQSSLTHMAFSHALFSTFVDRLRLWMQRDPATGRFIGIQDLPPLVDETGLKGRYDIVINAGSDEEWSATLQRQLGLKLEERKVPTEILIVDSATRPTAN
jgi:uncharacterized protein (TIGR03435 family)